MKRIAMKTPMYPSIGKSVNKDVNRDAATTEVVKTSPRASIDVALRVDEEILSPNFLLNMLNHILKNIETNRTIKGVHSKTMALGCIMRLIEVFMN